MANIINKGTGAGGIKTNINGSAFESKVAISIIKTLIDDDYVLEEIEKFKTKTSTIFKVKKNDDLLGLFGSQSSLFKFLNLDEAWEKIAYAKPLKDVRSVWSKTLIPDIYYFNLKTQKIRLIECKYQDSSGSVDEKLQTSVYKRELWNKLFKQYGISVTYEYVLGSSNDFWNKIQKSGASKGKKTYQDTFDYLKKNCISYKIDTGKIEYKIDEII